MARKRNFTKHLRKDVLILKNQQGISKFNVKSNRIPGEPQAPELGPGRLLNAESNNNRILALIFQRPKLWYLLEDLNDFHS